MSLIQNSQNAERQRGCFFADDFLTRASVEANNGTVSGTPQFGGGMVLNGTTDYVTYNVIAKSPVGSQFSAVVWFNPNFEANEDVLRRLFLTTTGFSVAKTQSALNNTLRIVMAGGVVGDIPYATYSPYWNTGRINRLAVTSTSGNTSVWLNGVQVLTGSATAWAFTSISDLYVGSGAAGANLFKGTIHGIRLFDRKLDNNEALSYSNGSVYSYKSQSVVNLPMRMAQHDIANARSLDISGYGNHAAWTAGVTAPTKRTQHPGYYFDGANSLMQIPSSASNTFGNGTTDTPFSISFWSKMDSVTAFRAVYKRQSPGNAEYQLGVASSNIFWNCFDQSSGGYIGRQSVYALSNHLKQPTHIVGTYDGSSTNAGMKFYIDAVQRDTANSTAGSYTAMENTGVPITIGKFSTGYAQGDIWDVEIYPTELTQMQVADLYTSGQLTLNRI